ncbi:MAG TPA: hypothetical protein VND93_07840 [Myxococcales bacterium]|nr:hypothetical protein [Myxococcales bacterium]
MKSSPTENLEALRSGYAGLRLGQTVDEVTALLGQPTSNTPNYSKQDRSAPGGTTLRYVVKSHGAAPNTNDEMITLVFDAGGRLIWAHPQNIPGLAELKAP